MHKCIIGKDGAFLIFNLKFASSDFNTPKQMLKYLHILFIYVFEIIIRLFFFFTFKDSEEKKNAIQKKGKLYHS